ncbi:MAG: NAD(P)-dependent glycerol-3-phosphate dehydrogenase [Eubacterium sp.]|jgi:glycerol-3-phosphate dehydrogenase (NAD(P)+)|nr:NAD(P)-dependent glycerol-3-phosphate dehydrogenase [Eubacterium sp.]
MAKTGVIGAGSWGCALADVLQRNGHQVTVWSILDEEVAMLKKNHEHIDKLPGVKLSEQIVFTGNLEEACRGMDLLVLAAPSAFTRSVAKKMAPFIHENQIIVSVAKGIEEESLMTLSDIIKQEIPLADAAVLCGPSHAEEVGRRLPTTLVAGAKTRKTAEYMQSLFMNEVFRVYTSPDVLGMELGGALKNVIALAAGMADGLGYGDNTKAALITRGIAEISRLAVSMGANAKTLSGLTGMGDLIVTCASRHSRNRKAGMLMGQGYTMQEAMDEVKMVVEGVYSAKAAVALGQKYQVSMPIIEQVNKVLFQNKPAKEAVLELMLRDRKTEHSDLEWEM